MVKRHPIIGVLPFTMGGLKNIMKLVSNKQTIMKKIALLIFTLLVTIFGYSQGHFKKIWSGSGTDQMTIYAIKGSIDGLNLQVGDEIAVFDNTDCVGVTILTGVLDDTDYNSMVTIICSSTDPGVKNGFTPGHDIVFKFWDASQSKEITLVTPGFVDINQNSIPAPKFASNESAFVKLTAITPTNQSPVAYAGSDQSVNEGGLVTLDGSASTDAENNNLTYRWTAPAGITLSSTTAAKPTFTAPQVTANTDYTFSLTVNNGTVDSPADQVVINVKNVDQLPYVKVPIDNISVDKGSAAKIVDLGVIFGDNDPSDLFSYMVTSNTNDQIVTAEVERSNLTLGYSTENTGKSEITISASSNGKSVQLTFEVEVKNPTGIENLPDSPAIQIYPNPSKEDITLDFGNVPASNRWITVYNASGEVVLKQKVNKSIETVGLRGNASGVYFIKPDQRSVKMYKVIVKP